PQWLESAFPGFALGNVGIGIYLVLGPFVANEHLGGKVAWGLILAAIPVGGLLGGIATSRIRPEHPVPTAFPIWSLCGVLPFALVRPFPLAAVMVAAAILGA